MKIKTLNTPNYKFTFARELDVPCSQTDEWYHYSFWGEPCTGSARKPVAFDNFRIVFERGYEWSLNSPPLSDEAKFFGELIETVTERKSK